MFRFVVLLASLLSAAAFRPAAMRSAGSKSVLKMSFEGEVGVLPPVGYFDPLGLAADGDVETFNRRRAVEIKHGRVAQLAVLGYIVPEFYRFPAQIDLEGHSFSDMANGLAAFGTVPAFGWLQIFLSIGWWELKGWEQASDYPGDFGFYNGKELDDAKLAEKRTKELQNGRLAMLAIMELLTHDVAKPAGESLLALHHF